MSAARCWIAVASAEHVRRRRTGISVSSHNLCRPAQLLERYRHTAWTPVDVIQSIIFAWLYDKIFAHRAGPWRAADRGGLCLFVRKTQAGDLTGWILFC